MRTRRTRALSGGGRAAWCILRATTGAGARGEDHANGRADQPRSAGGRRAARVLWAILIGLALGLVAPGGNAAAAGSAKHQVLILNAYDATYEWTADIIKGARSIFDTMDDVELSIEFLDSKKIFTPEYAALLAEIYGRKYGGMHFDLVVSSDDDALDFLKTYRDRLFPGVPVVFCGVNSFEDQRIAGFSNVTGVNEETNYDKSFEWVARLRPATRELVFVVDGSATSAAAIRQINSVAPRWRQRFAITFISNVTIATLEKKLRALPQDALVFWQMFMRDRDDTPLSMAESHRRVVSASPVPVFGFTGVSVSLGAAGGYVLSGFVQGETAARMGARILAGTPADRIPIVRHSPNVYMLDYPSFKRWNLDTDHPPPDTVVNNRPFSLYGRYRSYIWAVSGGMAAESLIILILIATIRSLTRRSRARLRESEERYRSIVEDGSELIARFDVAGKMVFANGALGRFMQLSTQSLIGRPFWSFLSARGADAERFAIKTPTRAEPIQTVEQPCTNGAGEDRWVLWTYRGLFTADGAMTGVQAVGHDITDRRAAEQAVRAALLRVEEGNVELGRVHRNLQDVLDSMKEGLLVCDRKGVLGPVRSRAVMDWFGTPADGARVWDLLFEAASPEREMFQMAFEQIADDVLPFELTVAQLPRTIVHGATTYGVTCQQVVRDGAFAEIVFTILDVTRELEQDRVERLNREQSAIVGNLMQDRDGFRELVEGTNQLLARLSGTPDRGEQLRLLHTLKGNTATYGFASFATRCHELEDLIAQGEIEAAPGTIDALTRAWQAAVGRLAVFLTDDVPASVRLSHADHQDLLHRLERRDDPGDILLAVQQWFHPPLSQVLGIHVRTVRQLALRLGKEIEARILDHGLRMTFDELRPFLAMLVHVVRNASDHGIESPDERERAGKPRVGHITIESRQDGPELVIAVEDDGRGIDWDAVRALAERRSLPAADNDDLIEALFSEGLSTRSVATEISGRGIGLGAVRAACRQLGGTTRIASQAGLGTRIEFRFLSPRAAPETAAGRAVHVS